MALKKSLALLVFLLSLVPRASLLALHVKSSLQSDALLVKKQLGYLPPNFRHVSAWTMDGKSPVAIQTYPLHGGSQRRQAKATKSSSNYLGTPFPTLYWLACPDISRAISDLERRGYVTQLEDRLNSDPDQAARFLQCHEHYAQERWTSLSEHDRTLLLECNGSSVKRMRDMLQSSGVAGNNHTAQLQADGSFVASVKCLHAHYAHYRSKQAEKDELNPVGYWVHELLLEQFPDTKV